MDLPAFPDPPRHVLAGPDDNLRVGHDEDGCGAGRIRGEIANAHLFPKLGVARFAQRQEPAREQKRRRHDDKGRSRDLGSHEETRADSQADETRRPRALEDVEADAQVDQKEEAQRDVDGADGAVHGVEERDGEKGRGGGRGDAIEQTKAQGVEQGDAAHTEQNTGHPRCELRQQPV